MTDRKTTQESYWDNRLENAFNHAGTGMLAYGPFFNWWVYQICKIRFKQEVGKLPVNLKNGTFLDVGCGTGFYLRQWQSLGAGNLVGLDISKSAITRLAHSYPGWQLIHADIGACDNPLPPDHFHAVSAMAVFFHIVDDYRLEMALQNINRSLKKEGYLILSDNFLHRERSGWGVYHTSRALTEYGQFLQKAGFTVIHRAPMFVLAGDPVDSRGRLLYWHWRLITWCASRSNLVGGLIGGIIFPLDLLLTAILKEGPTTEIMICQKR
ncbi:MAG: hypothetical protein C0616_13545 [Desulfuromonas sp.]|nr:MAG: hypothetical protein C0616_13545 [Desulfuromonas sp.]